MKAVEFISANPWILQLDVEAFIEAVNALNGKRRADGLSDEMTLMEFYQAWYRPNVSVANERTKNTIHQRESALARWCQLTGDPKLKDITKTTLTQFVMGMRSAQTVRRKPFSPASIRKDCMALASILTYAGPKGWKHPDAQGLINHTHYFADINTGADGLLITRAALTFTLEDYALEDHNHDTAYAAIDHLHAGTYSLTSHNHDAAYCPKWTNATMANNAVTLSTRKQWRYGANDITTVTITLNTGTITEFSALATFGTSSATPTVTITTTGSYTVKMVGSDCLDGTFTPYASTRYTIAFYWDGLYIIGKVSGYAYG